jgi:soluble lytic murein transglycosylase
VRRRKTWFLALLTVMAVPGLFLLARDILSPAREEVVDRAWHPLVERIARSLQVDPALVLAIIAVESRGDPQARGRAGERGLMQLMPATAVEQAGLLGLKDPEDVDLFDPETNITLGAAYLREQLRRFSRPSLALAAYNAGPARLQSWLDACPGVDPDEVLAMKAFPGTRTYVVNVLGYRELIAARHERNGKK